MRPYYYIAAGLVVVLAITFGALVLRPSHDDTVNQQGQPAPHALDQSQ